MSTAAAVEAKAPVTIVASDPVFINTVWGAVAVFGHELVSKKDLIILSLCLELPEFVGNEARNHYVRSVVFRDDNRPVGKDGKSVLANVSIDAGAICINLIKTIASAIDDSMAHPEVAIVASYHRNLITSFLHEIRHVSTLDDIPTDAEERQIAEDDAEVWSEKSLRYLAKHYDIEPAHHAESSVLAEQLMELLGNESDDPYIVTQRRMLENHMMYCLPETDTKKEVPFHTFKGYIQIRSEDFTSPEWDKETILGAGTENPLTAAIRAVSEVIPACPTPTTIINNTESSIISEYVEMDDMREAIVYQDFQPAFGGFPVAEPAIPMSIAGLNPVPTPAFGGFPIANAQPVAPAPVAPQPAPGQVPVFPATGLTNERTAEIVKGVYMKCYAHIFTHCQRLINSDFGFANPKAVYRAEVPRTPEEVAAGVGQRFRPFGITLTPEEMQVVVKMECMDINDRYCPNMPTSAGILYGNVMKNTQLPHYKITINMAGMEVTRLLLPQNPATKDGQGQYKKTAAAARAGSCIMYVMEGNDDVLAVTGKKYIMKVVDNQIVAC